MGQTPGTMRDFNRFSYSTFQLNAKQSPYQNKSKNNTDNKYEPNSNLRIKR